MEADKLREKGNQHYSDSEFRQALQMYVYACTRYKEIHSVVWEAKANSNISLTYLKLKEPKKAYDFAEKSLHLDPKMAKVRSQGHCIDYCTSVKPLKIKG